MLQHLFNCHGEWNLLIALFGSLPFVGLWLKMKIQNFHSKDEEDENKNAEQAGYKKVKKESKFMTLAKQTLMNEISYKLGLVIHLPKKIFSKKFVAYIFKIFL